VLDDVLHQSDVEDLAGRQVTHLTRQQPEASGKPLAGFLKRDG
jgi:hypothetical protein